MGGYLSAFPSSYMLLLKSAANVILFRQIRHLSTRLPSDVLSSHCEPTKTLELN